MSEEPLSLEEVILKQTAPLPVLSNGLRSRVLSAALEARETQQQSRRVIAGSLGFFALLSWFTWRIPKSAEGAKSVAVAHDRSNSDDANNSDAASTSNAPAFVDDFQLVEMQLRTRQGWSDRVHPM